MVSLQPRFVLAFLPLVSPREGEKRSNWRKPQRSAWETFAMPACVIKTHHQAYAWFKGSLEACCCLTSALAWWYQLPFFATKTLYALRRPPGPEVHGLSLIALIHKQRLERGCPPRAEKSHFKQLLSVQKCMTWPIKNVRVPAIHAPNWKKMSNTFENKKKKYFHFHKITNFTHSNW